MATWTATLLDTDTDEIVERIEITADTREEAEVMAEEEAEYQGYFLGSVTKK